MSTTTTANKLVVITGASSGIGEATAVLFAQKGYKLLLLARRKDRLEELVNDSRYSFNQDNTLIHQCDVTNVEDIRTGVELATKKFNLPVDCFINNAGIGHSSPLSEQSLDKQYAVIDVNIKGVLNGINVVAKDMVQRQAGTIINISSIAGRKTIDGASVYCGSKFAVHAISETLRSEVASSKVRVVLISPGVTESEITGHDEKLHEMVEGMKKGLTLGILKAQDVAESILYAYQAPPHVCLREIVLAPTEQSL